MCAYQKPSLISLANQKQRKKNSWEFPINRPTESLKETPKKQAPLKLSA